jgi:hypothetical protein
MAVVDRASDLSLAAPVGHVRIAGPYAVVTVALGRLVCLGEPVVGIAVGCTRRNVTQFVVQGNAGIR